MEIMFFREHYIFCLGLIVALALIATFDFAYSDTVELFKGGAKIAEILVNLSLAYIASIIVYYVTSYLPETQRRRGVSRGVRESTLRIKQSFEWFFNNQGSGIPTNEEIQSFIKKIDWNKNHPFLIRSEEGNYSFAQFSDQGNVPYFQALDSYLIRTILREVNTLSNFSSSLHPKVQDALFNLAGCKAVSWFASYPASEFKSVSNNYEFLINKLTDMAVKAKELNANVCKIYKNL
jgi:hypothetical protein